ncbi:hypothetical protein BJ875DRAFT_480792 [Amylocarpus encephaloides]|uniref:non-specific serine/threonine protein kinase n=1 Tax=Amylocarpus encephaloides TaxID=45428 RepID=A0A9P7YQT8_9HELO|nr:hypothetical protein BJ875DRAFT_480792 [Amylocarpus encephaloides]
MSTLALVSTPRTNNADGSVTKSLEIALSEFGSVLTDNERKQLKQIKGVPDASAALVFTAKLDASNSTRRGKSIGARAYSILQSIQQFSTIVDTFVSSHPDIAALVWGSVKLTVLIAANITSYFESLADLLMSLNKNFPQFDEYQLLFPNSPALRESICIFHASIIQLCKQTIVLTRQPSMELRHKLRPQIETIQNCANDVKKAIALAKATSDRKEQEFQEQERKRADKHRKLFSIFASQSQKVFDRNREWQLQRHQDFLREKKVKLLDTLSTWVRKDSANASTTSAFYILFTNEDFSSSVIDWLYCERTRANELTTFVFPRFDDSISLNAATVLRSIIRQSLKPDDVAGEVERHLSRFETPYVDMNTIEGLLKHCVSRFSTLYIVIDSLDEFEKEERNVLLQSLSSIISLPNSKAKLFLVGRSSVSADIQRWFPVVQEKSADCCEVQTDIEAYTRENIILRKGEQLIFQDPCLAQEIIKALINGANGMFLWVDFQIAAIYECTCDDEIREVLRALPRNLGETFDRAVKRILKRGSAKTANRIFQWVAAIKRALTLDELREALSYEPGIPYSIAGKRPNGLEHITAWCENLVLLDDELQIIQFTHRSVLQHFLEQPSDSRYHIKLEEADHFIGEICVTYLNSNDFKTDLIRNPPALSTQLPNHIIESTLEVRGVASRLMRRARMLNVQGNQKTPSNKEGMILIKNNLEDPKAMLLLGYPFLEYALDYWLLHTGNFEEGKSKTWALWKQMIIGSNGLAKTPWSPAEFHNRAPIVYEWIDKHDNFAVFLQNVSITRPSSTELRDLFRHYAELGRLKYINFMIDFVEHKKELSHWLLQCAGDGHLEVIQRLLDAKADVNTPASEHGRTALQAAAGGGHLEVVQRLLDAKADVNATPAIFHGRTTLQAAAGGGHLEVVQRLLDAKADVNTPASEHRRTALQAATDSGHLEVAQRLIDAKADLLSRRASYQAARALADLHAQGLFHGDVTTANILFSLLDVDHYTESNIYLLFGTLDETAPLETHTLRDARSGSSKLYREGTRFSHL